MVTDEDAYDVAANIIGQKRPQKADLERDFPVRLQKPVDTPYGPLRSLAAGGRTSDVRGFLKRLWGEGDGVIGA